MSGRQAFCRAAIQTHIESKIAELEKLARFDKGERRFAIGILRSLQRDIANWAYHQASAIKNDCKAIKPEWREKV